MLETILINNNMVVKTVKPLINIKISFILYVDSIADNTK